MAPVEYLAALIIIVSSTDTMLVLKVIIINVLVVLASVAYFNDRYPGQKTLQNSGRVPNRAYQSAVYAAKDESKDTLKQEMRGRKGNNGIHPM